MFQRSSLPRSAPLAWASRCLANLPVSITLVLNLATLHTDITATIILLQTAPMGFGNVGWKFYLVIICWSAFFIPGES